MNSKKLKQKLRQGDLCLGAWVTLANSAVAEIFAKAGFDWVVVDLEHSVISIDQAGDLIRTIDLSGSIPLVRLTSNDPNQIKRVLDAGAHGIVVPNINSAEDVKKAIAATRYAPQGSRGVGLGRAQHYGNNFNDYLQWQEDGPIVIVMIENITALDNLSEILSIPSVDGFIIGPYDLSCSMGIAGQFQNVEFLDALKFILTEGKRLKCPAGIHIVEPDQDQLKAAIIDGYKFIAYGVDIRMLDVSARLGVNSAKLMGKSPY